MSMRGKVIFITGASRGIGKAIAIRCAREGARIAIAAKTDTPHPKLPGTIHSAAEECRQAGGEALPLMCDIRDEEQVIKALKETADKWGRIDVVVNNASAISLTSTEDTPAKRYDLMNQVNARGTWLVSKHALPYLLKSDNPHILMLSPPLTFEQRWFEPHVAYTMAKFGMSMCVLGLSGEYGQKYGIAVNALWPRTAIDTAAMAMVPGVADERSKLRRPEIMADAAFVILSQNSREYTGQFAIDDDVVKSQGVHDLDHYAVTPGTTDFFPDFFIPDHHEFQLPPRKVLPLKNKKSKL